MAPPTYEDGRSDSESHEPVVHQPPMAFAARIATLPKLQRQLSLVMTRALGPDGLPMTTTTATALDEQIKVQRYERMMDRFQLRHVPLPRAASAGTPSVTSTTAPPLHRQRSTDLQTIAATAYRQYMTANGSIHAVTSDVDTTDPPASQAVGSSHQLLAKRPSARWSPDSLWRPVSPTGKCTRVRLLLLSLVFVVQLVYMPYGVAYYPSQYAKTLAIDTLVEVAYVLNVLSVANTEVNTGRGPLVTSRRAIWRFYRSRGLTMDLLAVIPVEILFHFVHKELWVAWIVRMGHLVIQYLSLVRHINRFHRSWKHEVMRTDKSVIAWILYSRYSHLVRIGVIVCLVMVMAHYFACVWSLLQASVDPTFLLTRDPLEIHIRSIYDSLQLLQGQGLPTTTPLQDLFGSIAVLLGSIALAVIFGHVAILVSNFSANQTSYQRTMERVFAIMGKFQLPHPIRERVHQYYEYLHAEYESLDGEIATFTKELSHTLELEVKQLVLNLSVRVYLPDDFIMRRGEVGTECYIINRGTCKQHEYATGNYEPPTLAMLSDDGELPRSRRRRSSQAVPDFGLPTRPQVQPQSKYMVAETGRSDGDGGSDGPYSRVSVLKRGQMLGDMALIMNYERSSDVRAVSYVEMCVLERETFQRILTRYPNDREIVLTSIVHHTVLHLAAEHVPCELMQMVYEVAPHASISTGIELVSKAINPRESDPSIVFGVTEELTSRLREAVARVTVDVPPSEDGEEEMETAPTPRGKSESASLTTDSDVVAMLKDIQERLARMEEHQQTCCRRIHGQAGDNQSTPTMPRPPRGPYVSKLMLPPPKLKPSQSLPRLSRRHTTKTGDLQSTFERTAKVADGNATVLPEGENIAAEPSSAVSTSRRILQDLVGTLWSRTTETPVEESHSPCADHLFQLRRQSAGGLSTHHRRRSSFVRTKST